MSVPQDKKFVNDSVVEKDANDELHPLWKERIPNAITVFRIVAVVPIIWLLAINTPTSNLVAGFIFVLASLSDYFDGMLARKFNVVSNFGKFIDPIADKVLVTSTLVMLIPTGKLQAIMVVILLARDTLISGLRSVAAIEKVIIPAGTLGKWKTATQMIAIPAVIIDSPFPAIPVYQIGYSILWVSVALSVISGVAYVWDYVRHSKVV